MLNHYGLCSSYTTIEELETEVTLSSYSESFITLPETKRSPNLFNGIAFDNLIAFLRHRLVKIDFMTPCVLYTNAKEKKMLMKLIKNMRTKQLWNKSLINLSKEDVLLFHEAWASNHIIKSKELLVMLWYH